MDNYVVYDVNTIWQPDMIQSHVGDKFLSMFVRDYLD